MLFSKLYYILKILNHMDFRKLEELENTTNEDIREYTKGRKKWETPKIFISREDIFLEKLSEKIEEIKDTYIYVKSLAKYYWVEAKIFFTTNEVCNNLLLSSKELWKMREFWIIKDYDNLVYKKWWKEGSYNLLNENSILQPSKNPVLHSDIEELISSVCWWKQENIEYIHKAILYKYLNINDFSIPAIVFYGQWWSGKGTFITLLSTIFWEENVLSNLWQRDLWGNFDTYRWWKIVVEFAEITTNNTHTDMGILNKLKNIIGAEKITINEKWVRQYQTENIAWFFISSNSNKPLQLDDKDKGNRRFSIIKSMSKLTRGKEINQTVRNPESVSNYLFWLIEKYPQVKDMKNLEPLDNEDKRDLEERGQNEANQFWEWLEDNQPNFSWKKTVPEIESKIREFCFDNGIDKPEFMRYFWHNSKLPKKKIRIWDKTYYWVEIPEKEEISVKVIEEIFH